jgi:hypothetical protein
MERRKQLALGIAALMLGIAPALMAEPADNAPGQVPPPAAMQGETARPQCPMPPQGQRDRMAGRDGRMRPPMMGEMGRMKPMAAMPQPGEDNCPMMDRMRMPSPDDRASGPREGRNRPQRESGLTPKAPMSEDDIAKFADLNAKLRNAVIDFRADGNDQTRAAVKTALDNLVAVNQAFEIDRCEKALARAKAKVQEKDEITKRILDRLTAQPKCDDDDAPKACPKGDQK